MNKRFKILALKLILIIDLCFGIFSATMLSEILRDFALLSTVFAAIVSCEQFSEEILILGK